MLKMTKDLLIFILSADNEVRTTLGTLPINMKPSYDHILPVNSHFNQPESEYDYPYNDRSYY